MSIELYEKAKKMGTKAYKEEVSQGRYPYLPVLDDIVKKEDIVSDVSLGLEDVECFGLLVLAPGFHLDESGCALVVFAVFLVADDGNREACYTVVGELTDFGILADDS